MTHSPGEAPEPLPCPFCGVSPVVSVATAWPERYAVDCETGDCFTTGLRVLGSSPTEAIVRWNHRRSSPESAATDGATAPIADALKRVERVLSLTDPDDESYHLGIARSQLREVRSSLRELLASSASVVSPETRDADTDAKLIERLRTAMRSAGPHYQLVEAAAERARKSGQKERADRLEHVYGRLHFMDYALGTLQERVAQDASSPSAPSTAPMNDAEYRASEGRFSAPSAPEGT